MAAIKTQNGSVIVRDGQVACECCEQELSQFNFGPTGSCNCETVLCYGSETNPSPPTLTAGSVQYTNEEPGGYRFVVDFGQTYLTSPTYTGDNITGWVNLVSAPSVMRLTGNVGGDIALWQLFGPGSGVLASQNGIEFPDNWNSVYRMSGVIPHEGDYPCGVCPENRNGPHPIDFTFVLWPYVLFRILPVTYLECFPWYRLRLRRVSAFTPP